MHFLSFSRYFHSIDRILTRRKIVSQYETLAFSCKSYTINMKRVLQLKKQLKDGKPFAEFVKPAVEDSKDVLFKMLQVAESV